MDNKVKCLIANWLLNPDDPGHANITYAEKNIKKNGLEYVYHHIELPLIEVLSSMQRWGLGLDQKRITLLKKKYARTIKILEKKIYHEAGERFNINSSQQLSVVLYSKLHITHKNNHSPRITKTGKMSTNVNELIILQKEHPIIPLILQYREAYKIYSTYIEPLSLLGNRVHTTFIQTGSATGRLSSQHPNLQNIPPAVREVFIADRGYVLVSLDYSQLELRILASLSHDSTMIDAFKHNKDIHTLTASKVFHTHPRNVTRDMRHVAKILNFGIVYGMGATAFARTSGLSRQEARVFIDEYFKDFSSIKQWQKDIVFFAKSYGYVENIHGRKRWFPHIHSPESFLVAEAERAAMNMPIQSLNADIIKLAMITIHASFHNNSDVRLVLSIHDELLFEIKRSVVAKTVAILKDIMENIVHLTVRLRVDIKQGKRWSDCV